VESLVQEILPASNTFWGFASDDQGHVWDVFRSELKDAVHSSREAWELMERAALLERTMPLDQVSHLREERVLVEFVHRTLVTALNTVRFLLVRDGRDPAIVDDGHKYRVMKEIAKDELSNVQHARALYEVAPWLDLSLRFDARIPSSFDMIARKERMLEAIIAQEH